MALRRSFVTARMAILDAHGHVSNSFGEQGPVLPTGERTGMNSFATRARRTRRTCGEREPWEVGGDAGAVVRYYGGLQAGYEYQAQ